MNLIDKDALVAEIEKLKDDAHRGISYHQSRQDVGLDNELSTWEHLESAFATILKIINTFEVKEVDLEQTARDESDDELYAIHFEKWNITGECPSELEAKIDAKFGITGRDSNGKPSNGYCDWKKDVFTNGASIYSFVKLGMDYQKEQMMKDAIEAPVSSTGVWANSKGVTTYANIEIPTKEELNPRRDKVKVIIIKE